MQLFAVKIKRFQVQLKTIEQELEEQTQKKTEWSTRYATFENQLLKLNIEIEESLNRLNSLREDIHKLTAQISSNEQTITFKKEQQAEAREDIEAAGGEITRMEKEVEGLLQQTDNQQRKLSDTSKEINDQEKNLEQLKEISEQKRDALQTIQDRVQVGKEKFLNCTNKQRVQTINSPNLKLNVRVLSYANKIFQKKKKKF